MGAVLLEELRTFTARLQCAEAASGDPGLGIDLLDAIEALKSVGCAVQTVITDGVATSIRADRRARGLPRAEWDRGIASQIALARRESPNRGGRHLGFAQALVHEMPHTLAMLRTGRLNEWRATLLVRETACLSAADRGIVDRRLCSDPAILDGVGDRGLIARAKALAVELDAAAVVARHRKAVSERRVTTRPAPDSMAYLSALMPVERAVCLQATLGRDADSLIATGNSGGRTRNQLMVDLLFERGTGASVASGVPVAVNLVLSDETLLADGHEAAQLHGFGAGAGRDCPAVGGRRRRSWHRDVAAAGVFVPAVGGVDGDGIAVPHVPEEPAEADRSPGSDVQDSVVRCADPASRSHPLTQEIGKDHRAKRVRAVRGLQLREGSTRVDGPTGAQPRPHPPSSTSAPRPGTTTGRRPRRSRPRHDSRRSKPC
ncbi:hypothetical protein W59_13926 [Rhodococcus opacus RKJ300 = JCM 13270]|uniref:DUF222 domain-containing protein n=1 Tax=Rhodococcus opacus RKJ300 = JCM 13270 TaxID=1165867 RepID=I0WSZ6_RHOOP|nr:hypothetical protein W59_13926 [Rhodococcus opacus RKJ300 = JCM 13270]